MGSQKNIPCSRAYVHRSGQTEGENRRWRKALYQMNACLRSTIVPDPAFNQDDLLPRKASSKEMALPGPSLLNKLHSRLQGTYFKSRSPNYPNEPIGSLEMATAHFASVIEKGIRP